MGIAFSRLDTAMTKQFWNGAQSYSIFQQVRGERVTQRVECGRFQNACLVLGIVKNLLCGAL